MTDSKVKSRLVGGKYELLASIGHGGMADVYLAVVKGPMGFNKLAVIKKLRIGKEEDPVFVDMFADEARLAARLNHPNVVHTYEVGEEDGCYYLVMEYLEGHHLRKIYRTYARDESTFTLPVLARVLAETLAGLHYAHELRDYDDSPLNIVHRDVSPHNVFVTYDGQVKLVDFGIAKAELNATATADGVLKGKASYMAPEQVMSGIVDRRADVFSVGVALWELLTKTRLFPGETAKALTQLMTGTIPKVAEVAPDVDPRLGAIADRALEKDPHGRFQTAAEMRGALEGYMAECGRVPTRDNVADAMKSTFGEERAKVKKKIQFYMTFPESKENLGRQSLTTGSFSNPLYAGSSSYVNLPTMNLDSSESAPKSIQEFGPIQATGSVAIVLPSGQSKNKHTRLLIAAVALILCGGAALYFSFSYREVNATEATALSSTPHAPTPPPATVPSLVPVDLSTDPPGAIVRFEGVSKGATPIVFDLPSGRHTLELEKAGFVTKRYEVNVPEAGKGPLVLATKLQREENVADAGRESPSVGRYRGYSRARPQPSRPPPPETPTATKTSVPAPTSTPNVEVIGEDDKPNVVTIE